MSGDRLHKLRVFACIVESGSMTAAGRTLGLSRSVVSGHLKSLEADFGVRLIDRTTRSMRVTPLGLQVHGHVREMLAGARAAIDAVEEHLGAVRGLVRIAAPNDLGPTVLVPVVRQLCNAHPDLRIEAVLGDRRLDMTRDGIDVALRVGIPRDGDAILHRLGHTDELLRPASWRSTGSVTTLGIWSDCLDWPMPSWRIQVRCFSIPMGAHARFRSGRPSLRRLHRR